MLAAITIRIAGRQAGESWPIRSIETESSVGVPSRAEITFAEFEPLSSLAIGTGLEIDVNQRTIFRGRVSAHRLSILQGDPPALIVELRGDVPAPPSTDLPVMILEAGETIFDLDLTLDQSSVCGLITCEGTALVTPGANVELRRLPGHFDRTITAAGVRHRVRDGQWTTTLDAGDRIG